MTNTTNTPIAPTHTSKTKTFQPHRSMTIRKTTNIPKRFAIFANFLRTKIFSKFPSFTPVSYNHIIQILNSETDLSSFLQKNPNDVVMFHYWLDTFLRSKGCPYLLNCNTRCEIVKIPYDSSLILDESCSQNSSLSNTSSPISEPPVSPATLPVSSPLPQLPPSPYMITLEEEERDDQEVDLDEPLLSDAKVAEDCGLLCEFFLSLDNENRLYLLQKLFKHDPNRSTPQIESSFKILYTENPCAFIPDYLFVNDYVFLTFLNQFCLISRSK